MFSIFLKGLDTKKRGVDGNNVSNINEFIDENKIYYEHLL